MTPVTTRDGTPAAGNEVTSSSNLPEGPDQKTSAPSAVPVQDDAPKFEDTASTEPTTTLNLDDLSNLHMYLLRASIQPGNATNHILHLAHQINRVPVPRSEIISRLQKLSPDYSVAKALEELNPEEFRLVVEHANGLNGTIVSVQRTEDVERITQMGTLKLRSFCFFMTTPERLQLEQKRAPLQQERPSINYPSVSQTAFTTHGAERRESPEGRGIFSNPDFVPHQEKDYAGVAKFETITSDPNYGNYSLEELRLRDYQAGRNQSTTREAGPTTKRPNFGDSGPAPNFTRSWKKLLADKSQPSARGRSLFDPPETARDQPKSLFGHFGPAPKANNPSTTDSISGSNAPQGSSLFPGTASNVTKDTPTAVGWFLASKATKTSPFDGFGSKDNTTKTPVGFWGECAQCSTLPCRCSWSGSGTACGRSDGVSGRQNKPSRGLFGSNPEIATMHSGGLFGGQQSKPFGSIFGSTPATQTSSAGGLFGGFGGPQNKPSGGLFGSNPGTQTSTHTGLFGGNPSQPQASNPFANSAPPIFARGFGSQPGPVKPDPGNPIRKTFGTGKHGEQISDDVNQRMEQMRKDIEQMKLKMAIKQASPKEESSKETQSRSQDNSPKESNKSENEEAEQSALYGPVSPPFDEDDL